MDSWSVAREEDVMVVMLLSLSHGPLSFLKLSFMNCFVLYGNECTWKDFFSEPVTTFRLIGERCDTCQIAFISVHLVACDQWRAYWIQKRNLCSAPSI